MTSSQRPRRSDRTARRRGGRVPRWLKALMWLVVIAMVVVLLFTEIFPRVERILEDPTMGAGTPPPVAVAQDERAPR